MSKQPGNLWSTIFRRPRRAARLAREHAEALARIEKWTFPFSNESPTGIPVHLVAGRDNWRFAAWMLASWFHFSERCWPVVIHDDGTLPENALATLQRLFPPARIIGRPEADAALAAVLLAFPFCETLRSDDPAALKLFDAPHFCTTGRFFAFDPDVLFFNYPHTLVDWAERGGDATWFAEAEEEHSLVSAAEARDELGVNIWPHADTGIGLIHSSAFDLDFFDTVLAQTSILRGSLENASATLAMLGAARVGRGGLLPRTYEVSLARAAAPNAISRHYLGGARERFFDDGLKRVTPHLFAPEEPLA
jgi:hypothetical protein